ncbi:MAG TPA: RNA-directed DNA polymerase [Tepidisphaeraceae bacterium]|jgi:hypothetical protein|nr:RNA-directed DNA polymerase [Tepidisphaeraceae bacterium]
MATKTVVLDLKLAWQRVKQESIGRGFTRHPFEMELAESDLDSWLTNIGREFSINAYRPNGVYIANVPKGKGAVRPGACIALKDRLVYAACVGAVLHNIRTALTWPNRTIDFSYPLSQANNDPKWIRGEFQSWQRFREASLELLKARPYAVLADITGYYENIDLATLRSDLVGTGADESVVTALMVSLNRWAQIGGRGIPQGQNTSDILGKLYLNSVDRSLYQYDYLHCRYVDDIRIFCN